MTCTKPYDHTQLVGLQRAVWYSRPVWAKPGSVATVVSEKSLRRKMTPRTGAGVMSSETALCFLAQHTDKTHTSGDDKPRDPHNVARPRVNWIFFKGSIREFCLRGMSAMSGNFVEVSLRSGLGAGSREVESETNKKEA